MFLVQVQVFDAYPHDFLFIVITFAALLNLNFSFVLTMIKFQPSQSLVTLYYLLSQLL